MLIFKTREFVTVCRFCYGTFWGIFGAIMLNYILGTIRVTPRPGVIPGFENPFKSDKDDDFKKFDSEFIAREEYLNQNKRQFKNLKREEGGDCPICLGELKDNE
jgi:hypothetical protein